MATVGKPPVSAQPVASVGWTWTDGKVLTCITQLTTKDYTLVSGVPKLIAPQDIQRVGLGICMRPDAVDTIFVAPWPDVDVASFGSVTKTAPQWFVLPLYMTLVGYNWYAYSTGTPTLRTVYIRRR